MIPNGGIERERQTDRQRDRERETERERDRDTERDRERDELYAQRIMKTPKQAIFSTVVKLDTWELMTSHTACHRISHRHIKHFAKD